LDAAAELAHYQQHQNDPDDSRYRAFLSKLADPLLAKLSPGMSGLDYGCGPGPALAAMLTEAGLEMSLYDPLFHHDSNALQQRYDVVTLSEVAEHFFDPALEFEKLDRLLRPGGWLGVMTCFQTEDDRFADWHYRRDPTHVVFYRARTFEVIAEQRGWSLEIPRKDVVLMQKPA
jgi:2-polyprenyl-3-methyl-5-hydroxy-6-metoxy-1,4-benzoquinol methylase